MADMTDMRGMVRGMLSCLALSAAAGLGWAQGFNPYYVPGGMGCPGRVERHGIAWVCRCPDGRLARGAVINGRWVSVCDAPRVYNPPAPPVTAVPPATPPPPIQAQNPAPPSEGTQQYGQPSSVMGLILRTYRGCLDSRAIEGLVYAKELVGFSYAKRTVWRMQFTDRNRVMFTYESGRREENIWTVKGTKIYLRNPANGRLIGTRKLCIRGKHLEWVSGSGKRLGRILALEETPVE